MRVRVAYTVKVTDEYRRAINRFYGRPGMATRADVASWFAMNGESMDDVVMSENSDEATAQQEARETERKAEAMEEK